LAHSAFTREGDHVIPESLGGTWIDHQVCEACNKVGAGISDKLIARDFLVRFLRAFYRIPDRNNTVPLPPVFPIHLAGGGVIKATLTEDGPAFEAGVPPRLAEELDLQDLTDQTRLRSVVHNALGRSPATEADSIELARIAQQQNTPYDTWSRFMAKLALACGREAYGDHWLDSRQARILSHDLLGDDPPRFGQRDHHPPVEEAWPYEPPKHRLWIAPYQATAVLHIALFGQVLGAVPVNDLPADAYPSAWSLDPRHSTTGESRVHRFTYQALHLASVARRAQERGATAITILDPEHPFVYIPDRPDGPFDLGGPTQHVDSFEEGVEFARRARASHPPASGDRSRR
jgi:hypothetical protein